MNGAGVLDPMLCKLHQCASAYGWRCLARRVKTLYEVRDNIPAPSDMPPHYAAS